MDLREMSHSECFMSEDGNDKAAVVAGWDELAGDCDDYLAAISELFAEWLSEADRVAYDDL